MKAAPVFNRQSPATRSSGGGKSPAELVRQSNRWRDNYNPLRSLVIARVVAMLEAAERGDFAELQLTMRKLERRYPVLKGLKARRLAALEKLDWDIKTVDELPEGATEAMAEAQKQFLRSRYELIENLTEALGFLASSEFRGYAILQKHRYADGANDGAVRELHWIPQDQFSRDGQFGDFFYNQDSRFGIGLDSCVAVLGEANRIGGADLPREEFILRESDSPLYEIAMIAFVNWSMGRKDNAAFVEIFGLPNAIVIMPPNIPQGQEDDYRSAAEKVADGVSGALPNGSDAKFPTASVRGNAPFKEFCDAQDADVVLAGTSGLLTMLSMPTGIGQGATGEHADAFDDLAQGDARKINFVLQRDFDKLELAQQFPGQPVLAYFELCAIEEDDATEVITQVASLKTAGYTVSREQVEEKTGYELEEQVEPDAANATPSPSGRGQGEGELDSEGNPVENRALILNGDLPGHEFHGNQYTEADANAASEAANKATSDAWSSHKVIGASPEETRFHSGAHLGAHDSHRKAAAIWKSLSDKTQGKEFMVGFHTRAAVQHYEHAASDLTLRNRATPAESAFLEALAQKTDPVLAILNRITEIKDDAAMLRALEQFYANTDALAKAVAADATKAALALEQITAPALAKGLAGK